MAIINKTALVEKLLLTNTFAGQTKKYTTEFVEDFFQMIADEVIAGNTVRIVVESAGIKDILTKSKGSSNPHNMVKATMDALISLKDPAVVAKQRGIPLEELEERMKN